MREKSNHLGTVLALTAATTFGSVAVLAKLGFEAGAEPLSLLTLRFTIAFLLLLAFGVLAGKTALIRPSSRGQIWLLMLLGAFGYGGEAFFYFEALERSPAATVALIFFTYPLWTVILSFLAGLERIGSRLMLALLMGLIGISVVFPLSRTDIAGPLLALVGAIVISLYFLTAEKLLSGISPLTATTWTTVGAAIGCGGASFAGEGLVFGDALPVAAGLGVITTIAYTSLFESIQLIGSSRSAIATMLEPLITVILAAIVLSEPITLRVAVGSLFVISCIALLATAPSAQRGIQPDAPEVLGPESHRSAGRDKSRVP